MRTTRLLPVLIAALLPVLAAPPADAAARSATPERDVVTLVNEIRRDHGLPPLRVAPGLALAARTHSRDMLRRSYFSHPSRDGESFHERIRRFHAAPVVGENIAWGTGSFATPQRIVRMWMESPGHRAIILDRAFRAVGVGRASGRFLGRAGAAVYTADFASR